MLAPPLFEGAFQTSLSDVDNAVIASPVGALVVVCVTSKSTLDGALAPAEFNAETLYA